MRNLDTIKKDLFSLNDAKRAYRVDAKKAQEIIDTFIKEGLVVAQSNGLYKKVKNPIEATKEEPVEEKETNKVVEPEVKEDVEKVEADIFDVVADTELPIPYLVTTSIGVYELSVKNAEELKHTVNRVTGWSGAEITKIERLR